MEIRLQSIGTVRSARTGRGDDYWGGVRSRITLDERFTGDALRGLEAFSHVEIVFLLHEIGEEEVESGSRHPRNNPAWPKVGIFAQRGARRPNRIAVSRCRLLEVDGCSLLVEGLDAIDETPVLDIKPFMREFGVGEPVRQPQWATELMEHYYDVSTEATAR